MNTDQQQQFDDQSSNGLIGQVEDPLNLNHYAYMGGCTPITANAFNPTPIHMMEEGKEPYMYNQVYEDDAEVVGIEPSFRINHGDTSH